jgi:hypothetical protein
MSSIFQNSTNCVLCHLQHDTGAAQSSRESLYGKDQSSRAGEAEIVSARNDPNLGYCQDASETVQRLPPVVTIEDEAPRVEER